MYMTRVGFFDSNCVSCSGMLRCLDLSLHSETGCTLRYESWGRGGGEESYDINLVDKERVFAMYNKTTPLRRCSNNYRCFL